MNQLEFLEDLVGDVVVIKLKGRLDAITSPPAEKRILNLISEGHSRLLLDLAEVDYISSAGMRTLLIAHKRLAANGGMLILSSISKQVAEVLRMAGFDKILYLVKTNEEGFNHFKAPLKNG